MSYLSMFRGDDRTLTITATEDLAGSEIRFTAKQRRSDAVAVIAKSLGSGITLGNPTTTAEVVIDAADTDDLDPVALYWDVEVTDATDKIRTVASGRLAIREDVSRPA